MTTNGKKELSCQCLEDAVAFKLSMFSLVDLSCDTFCQCLFSVLVFAGECCGGLALCLPVCSRWQLRETKPAAAAGLGAVWTETVAPGAEEARVGTIGACSSLTAPCRRVQCACVWESLFCVCAVLAGLEVVQMLPGAGCGSWLFTVSSRGSHSPVNSQHARSLSQGRVPSAWHCTIRNNLKRKFNSPLNSGSEECTSECEGMIYMCD